MKRIVSVLILVGFTFGVYLSGQSSVTITPGSLLSACPTPVVGSKATILCPVVGDPANPDGLYVSTNGSTYSVGQAGGVKTIFGRTGDVKAATGDYSYGQLSGTPTKVTCSTATISASGLVASGCVIN